MGLISNTWNSMVYTNIAQRGLSALKKSLAPLSAFTTDLSAEAKQQGTTVATRIVPAAASTQDLVDDLTSSYASACTAVTTTTVTLTLDDHPVTGFCLTDSEAQQIGAGVWSDTLGRLVDQNAYAIAAKVLLSTFNNVTASHFDSDAVSVAASLFDREDVVTLRTACVNDGWRFDGNESLLLNADYYGALLNDTKVIDNTMRGDQTFITGIMDRVLGFSKVYECPTLPTNSEALVGFAAKPEALVIVMRGVDTQATSEFQHFEILQDPDTGVVMTYSAIFNRDYRRIDHVFEALYAVDAGIGEAIHRITSS